MTERELKKFAVVGLLHTIKKHQERIQHLKDEKQITYYNCKIADMEIECDKLINELLTTPDNKAGKGIKE